jgi:hypothetical protein
MISRSFEAALSRTSHCLILSMEDSPGNHLFPVCNFNLNQLSEISLTTKDGVDRLNVIKSIKLLPIGLLTPTMLLNRMTLLADGRKERGSGY